MLLDRLSGEVDVERAVEIIASGAEPLRELIGAMHSKLLLGRAAPPARASGSHQQTSWSSITPKPAASARPPGSAPEKVPNGWR